MARCVPELAQRKWLKGHFMTRVFTERPLYRGKISYRRSGRRSRMRPISTMTRQPAKGSVSNCLSERSNSALSSVGGFSVWDPNDDDACVRAKRKPKQAGKAFVTAHQYGCVCLCIGEYVGIAIAAKSYVTYILGFVSSSSEGLCSRARNVFVDQKTAHIRRQ